MSFLNMRPLESNFRGYFPRVILCNDEVVLEHRRSGCGWGLADLFREDSSGHQVEFDLALRLHLGCMAPHHDTAAFSHQHVVSENAVFFVQLQGMHDLLDPLPQHSLHLR